MNYTDDDLLRVYQRTRGFCLYCNGTLFIDEYGEGDEEGAWEVDHFIPIARGGADKEENWVPACTGCNREKGDQMPWEFEPERFIPGIRNPDLFIST